MVTIAIVSYCMRICDHMITTVSDFQSINHQILNCIKVTRINLYVPCVHLLNIETTKTRYNASKY